MLSKRNNYVFRDVEALLEKGEGLMTAVVGPRRSGKSTLLENLRARKSAEGHPPTLSLWIDADRLVHRERLAAHPDSLERWIEETIGRPVGTLTQPPFYLYVDEAQKVPTLFEAIKVLYDRHRDSVRIFLSGSATLELFQKSAETLAGRVRYLRLYPFSLLERCRAKGMTVGEMGGGPLAHLLSGEATPTSLREVSLPLYRFQKEIQKELAEALVWGSFPQVVQYQDPEARRIYLQNYKETYLEKDIRPIEWVGDLHSYSNLLTLLAESEGNLIQYKQLSQTVGIAHQTLKKYLSLLEATFLQYFLYPYIFHAKRRLQKAPKTFFADLGLVSLLSNFFDYEALVKTGAIGHRFESFVIGEVRKHLFHFQKPGDCFFWRTSGGVEVDCVFRGARLIPIEAKFSETTPQKSLKDLKQFMSDYACPYGVLFYNGPFDYRQVEKVFLIPAWFLL